MLIRAALGVISVLGVNSLLKDNKQPKTKEEIKDSIRKSANTISKYASAIYEVADEGLNKQYKKYDIEPIDDDEIESKFKNIRKGSQD